MIRARMAAPTGNMQNVRLIRLAWHRDLARREAERPSARNPAQHCARGTGAAAPGNEGSE